LSEYLKVDSPQEDGFIIVYFKDLGTQVSWTTVFLVEYAGPILITGLILAARKFIYGSNPPLHLNQKLGVAMVVGHYLKRELETLFVHRFSNETMPIFNIFKNCAHYWILMGLSIYFLLHPKYTPPAWATPKILYGLTGAFTLFELMNLKCHIILRNLRPPGSTVRGIPRGGGFGLVSCANYMWEGLSWLTFSIQSQTLFSWVFFCCSAGQMLIWALKKHKKLRQDFKDYPKKRKAMIPFVI